MAALRPTLDFLLYDWLHAERLAERPRFADHSRDPTCAEMPEEAF